MKFVSHRQRHVFYALLLLGACSIAGAMAQGFPGGGGKAGGHNGMRPSGGHSQPAPSAEPQQASSPLATFLGDLHALRTELLIRDDQAAAWSSMRDTLRAYVDLESPSNDPSMDPLQRIRNLADDTRARADALAKVGDSIGVLMPMLDNRQRETFGTHLVDAFAAGHAHSR